MEPSLPGEETCSFSVACLTREESVEHLWFLGNRHGLHVDVEYNVFAGFKWGKAD